MAGFGGTVKLQGESEYRKALKEIQSSLRLVSSELKLTNSEFKNGDKNLNDTKNSYNNMNSAIKEQKEKVADLRKTVAQMSEQYGENNEKVKVFKTQLNNAENQLVKMENATDKNNSELKEMQNNLDNAGTSSIKFGDLIKANVISEAIISGVKALGSAMKQVGFAIIDMGKKSLEQYANYEQLVGGVDTLFKESSNKVQEYANNAYKTSGLSANEYMETITSFSASLLQSLNGDTAKSAKVADMAIIDMSDNANKMGTDMSMIQSAYQGFAKQNYTMLDNLKLGYGGTKTEMQRLIQDASQLTDVQKELGITVDANDMSFGNIVNAISVVQSKMGIMGTTSKEASETISGSVNSMKSAWSNLITGIADDNANFSELVDNFVESVLTVGDNIMPRIQTVLDGIVNLVLQLGDKLLPQILEMGVNLITNLVNGISNNIGNLMNGMNKVINTIITSFIKMLPQILQMGIQIIVSLIQGLAQQLPTLIPQIVDTVILIAETLIDNIDLIIDAGIELIIGLAEGLIEALPRLIDKIPVIIDKLVNALANNLPKIVEAGIQLTIQLAVGIVKAIPQLVSKVPQIITSFINALISYYGKLGEIGLNLLIKIKDGIASGIGKMAEVGLNLVKGLWNGINNAKDWLFNKIKGFKDAVLNKFKSFFGIHSPSTLFREQIGENLALGIGEGFTDEMANVTKEMQDAMPTSLDTNIGLNGSATNGINSNYSYNSMLNAFQEALASMKIELDDEVAGKFVKDTVATAIYT